ncbi:hypothetical protein ACTJJ4_07900 [Microbacterium sp. 22195]|uniref:hypothetical protein n=1 Tax=Microbacterium sp. 22195 TaxID=3453891 RepID=UPI003F845392
MRIDLNEYRITRDDETWFVNFPHLEAWQEADPATDPEMYREFTEVDVALAIGYAAAQLAIAAANLRDEAILENCGDINTSIASEGGMVVSRRARIWRAGEHRVVTKGDIAAALEDAARVIAGDPEAHEDHNAADVLARRQQHLAHALTLQERLRALAGDDRNLFRSLTLRVPNIFTEPGAAEAAIAELEADTRAALIQRAAAAQVRSSVHAAGSEVTATTAAKEGTHR